ncbi:MAG: DUF3800 domain-containing protein [Candidatus Sumerlaeota bacterium]|nr:DUF3800 domain-containing protein [Candidatus Sumerlaeota bacterium]
MHLIYMDESGQTGLNLTDPAQPIFVLAALIVPESVWNSLESDLIKAVEKHCPPPRPSNFEIHATAIRNGDGYFHQFTVTQRLAFRDECLQLAHKHDLKFIYRAIAKKRFLNWTRDTFGGGVFINPHVAAFPLVARVVDEYLSSLPEKPLGIFIADENREIISDVEKTIYLLRGAEGSLKLSRIIEKGFFIDSAKSLVLQLCDLCAYSARKKEEARGGIPVKPIDQGGIDLIEPIAYRGNEALQDTLQWLVEQQQKKGAARE